MSRSCHSATSSSAAAAFPRRTRARPVTCSDLIGLRLWGIALEPFWPRPNGSRTSPTSVRARWRISVAKRSKPGAGQRDRLQELGVAVTRHHLGRHRLALQPQAGEHARLELRGRRRVRSRRRRKPRRRPPGRRRAPTAVALRSASNAKPASLIAERRRLGMDAVGAADAQGVDVLARLGRQRLDEPAGIRQDQLGDVLDLQRQARVEHVAGGQPVVDPAPGRAGRFRQHVDECGGVVVGDLLALIDRLDGERRRSGSRPAPASLGPSISSQAATSTSRIASNRADRDQALAELAACVPRDQRGP